MEIALPHEHRSNAFGGAASQLGQLAAAHIGLKQWDDRAGPNADVDHQSLVPPQFDLVFNEPEGFFSLIHHPNDCNGHAVNL
jgi:hypothetical protein